MKTKLFSLAFFAALLMLASCGGNDGDKKTEGSEAAQDLQGAGASFPYPLYSKMFDAYHQSNKTEVNYQSIGSGGGIKQLQSKTVDFGASDAPMSDEELSKAAPIVHIPTCLGAVVITYNLPGNPKLRFTPDVLADIFLGKIKNWNDPRIHDINPDQALPSTAISVIHRSDGSGTTYIFSDYLSKVSADWKTKPGTGKSLDWPAGLGAKGNEGVSGLVKQTPGSIGYVELVYAMQNKMPVAELKNKSGNFIDPTIESTSASANVELPADLRVSLTDTEAPDGYPISSFTYILVYKEQKYDDRAEAKAKETLRLISWMIHDGQQYTKDLGYAPLPNAAVTASEGILKAVTFDGKPLLEK